MAWASGADTVNLMYSTSHNKSQTHARSVDQASSASSGSRSIHASYSALGDFFLLLPLRLAAATLCSRQQVVQRYHLLGHSFSIAGAVSDGARTALLHSGQRTEAHARRARWLHPTARHEAGRRHPPRRERHREPRACAPEVRHRRHSSQSCCYNDVAAGWQCGLVCPL